MEGGWFDDEAIAEERLTADMEMAAFEEEGRRYGKRKARAAALMSLGEWEKAAAACPHSGGFPLDSIAAENDRDPNAGEKGVRCWDCGSRLSCFPWDGPVEVLVACETKRKVG